MKPLIEEQINQSVDESRIIHRSFRLGRSRKSGWAAYAKFNNDMDTKAPESAVENTDNFNV